MPSPIVGLLILRKESRLLGCSFGALHAGQEILRRDWVQITLIGRRVDGHHAHIASHAQLVESRSGGREEFLFAGAKITERLPLASRLDHGGGGILPSADDRDSFAQRVPSPDIVVTRKVPRHFGEQQKTRRFDG